MTAEITNSNISIILTNEQLEDLVCLATSSLHNESCALLLSKNNIHINGQEGLREVNVIINDIIMMRNSDESRLTFSIEPQELINAYQVAEKRKLHVVGIFHSHPVNHPLPSMMDKKFMEVNPVVWLIYSVARKKFKAYIFEENKIKKVSLSLVKA